MHSQVKSKQEPVMMVTEKKLFQARQAFRDKAWNEAYNCLSDAASQHPLNAADLELLAVAAYLLGKTVESTERWSQAHATYLNSGHTLRAIRCGFWLGFMLLNTGEPARGSGWIARAKRLLDQENVSCVEQGYLLLPVALQCLAGGRPAEALQVFEQAGKIGGAFREADLLALSLLGRGQALIRLGQAQAGLSLFDEAMADLDSGALSPIPSGIVYCGVIEACVEIYDVRRAQEWTEALRQWCASQPDLVPFRGECMVRRSEIMQLYGDWEEAIAEAERAAKLLLQMKGHAAAGAAFYQLGELYRLKGDYPQAEEAYRQASHLGRTPQPGLALLRLGQGQVHAAATIIRHALQEAKTPKARARILPAYTDIMVSANELSKAGAALNELRDISDQLQAPELLRASVYQAEGSVLLAQGDPENALEKLNCAMALWKGLGAAYALAQARVLVGQACRQAGDHDAATLEFQAALSTFQNLNANPDVTRLEAIHHSAKAGLTSRELEVLRYLSTGKTNKSIAAEMFLSERTVDRHVSNILAKLNIPSRAAATAYAYEHGLI